MAGAVRMDFGVPKTTGRTKLEPGAMRALAGDPATTAVAALCRPDARPMAADALPPLEDLFSTAIEHDVVAPLVVALLAGKAGDLAEEVREGLDIWREGARFAADDANAQLTALLGLLAGRGIPCMPFKGPLLASEAFGDTAARSSVDLDVLVHPDDVDAVLACLVEAGYRHQYDYDIGSIAALRRYAGQYILFPDIGVPVEPHWLPAPRTMAFDLDMEAFWRRARPGTFLGAECYLPSAEDHLLLLAVHGGKEQWHKLKWSLDIAWFLARHPDLDLDTVRRDAAARGCRRAVDLALLLSHQVYGQPDEPPPADRVTARLAARVRSGLCGTVTRPQGPYLVTRFHWLLRERPGDRMRYCLRTLFIPRVPHFQRLPLPNHLRWLHVLIKVPWDYAVTPAMGFARRFRRLPS